MILAAILFVGLYAMNKKHYYQVDMQSHKTTVDEDIVQMYVEKYWKEVFPDQKISAKVLLHRGQKIEIIGEFPDVAQERQNELLEKMEFDLSAIFKQNLGYGQDFKLTVVLKR